MNEPRREAVSAECLGSVLTAEALALPSGVQAALYGGDLPHIGAVGVADPDGAVSVRQFPGHREGELARRWTERLAKRGRVPVVLCVGIHYDDLAREDIETVVRAADALMEALLERL